MTEWQVYRMFEARRGAWSTFQFLVRERLVEAGTRSRRTGGCARALMQRRELARGRAALVRRPYGRQRPFLEVRSGRKRSRPTSRRR